jgi:transcriptional regulator of NAD metabolism
VTPRRGRRDDSERDVGLADKTITQNGADADLTRRAREVIVGNLRLLRDAGVNVVISSDRYSTTSAPEAFALRGTGVNWPAIP